MILQSNKRSWLVFVSGFSNKKFRYNLCDRKVDRHSRHGRGTFDFPTCWKRAKPSVATIVSSQFELLQISQSK